MSAPFEGGPQVNKFEQVSSDGHQISLPGALGPRVGAGGLMYDVQGAGVGLVLRGALHSEVQYIMGNGHIWNPRSPEQTGTHLCKQYLPTTSLAGG